MEKDSYSSTTTKTSFIRRSASFGNISPFSSRGNKHIFRAYPSTLKIAELCFETTALIQRRQRKLRLLESRPALVTFHLFLVGATNIFSELIHPLLKLLNCVLKQQPHILQLSEVIGSGFSLFEEREQNLSAYCHFHSFIDLPENTTLYTETMLN